MYDKIKALAQEKGISITNLEKQLGLGNGTIVKWMEVKNPRINTIKKVADFFKVPIEYFLED